MTWKDNDEVVTTYGSLQLGLEQAHAAGVKTEQERIIKLIDAYAMKDLTLELDESLKESLAFVANTYANMGHDFGVIDERERIIKLLETYVGLTGMFGLERDEIIAFIKGENK